MRKSYIAKGAEALNLHNGNQTAIVVKMKVQPNKAMWNTVKTHPKTDWCDEHGKPLFPPYQIGQEVYVRETIVCNSLGGAIYRAGGKVYAGLNLSEDEYIHLSDLDKSDRGFIPLCKEKHARTRFKIVGCEAVRGEELTVGNGLDLGCGAGNWGAARELIISNFGQSAWDNNDFIWYYKIEKI